MCLLALALMLPVGRQALSVCSNLSISTVARRCHLTCWCLFHKYRLWSSSFFVEKTNKTGDDWRGNDDQNGPRCYKFHAKASESPEKSFNFIPCSVISSVWTRVPILPCRIIILPFICALRRPDLIKRQNRTASTEFQFRPISASRQYKHIPSVHVSRHWCECVGTRVCTHNAFGAAGRMSKRSAVYPLS